MKTKKILALMLCTALLSVATVLGTLAYLTSRDSVTNTFTVGNVEIKLDEHLVDDNGDKIPDDQCSATGCRTDEGEQYHILPGETYDKDPMVTVKANSEASYVRMILTVHNASAVQAIVDNEVHKLTDYADLFAGWDTAAWIYHGFTEDKDANTISFEFRYKEVVDASNSTADIELTPLFTQLVVPGTLTNAELQALYGADTDSDGSIVGDADDFKIVVEGHAIQALGFEADAEKNLTAEDVAWAAFETQYAAAQTTGE